MVPVESLQVPVSLARALGAVEELFSRKLLDQLRRDVLRFYSSLCHQDVLDRLRQFHPVTCAVVIRLSSRGLIEPNYLSCSSLLDHHRQLHLVALLEDSPSGRKAKKGAKKTKRSKE